MRLRQDAARCTRRAARRSPEEPFRNQTWMLLKSQLWLKFPAVIVCAAFDPVAAADNVIVSPLGEIAAIVVAGEVGISPAEPVNTVPTRQPATKALVVTGKVVVVFV